MLGQVGRVGRVPVLTLPQIKLQNCSNRFVQGYHMPYNSAILFCKILSLKKITRVSSEVLPTLNARYASTHAQYVRTLFYKVNLKT